MNRKTFIALAETIKQFYLKHTIYSDVTIALNAHKYNESCKNGKDKIDFFNIYDFVHHNKPFTCISDVITYHLSGKPIYYNLQDVLQSCNQN